jgi:hypothetical protein
LELCGKAIRIDGNLVRIGYLDGEGYQFLEDPEVGLQALRKSGSRIDLFTFIQKLSDASPKYNYPMEWDNLAVLRISTFNDWMTHQINFKVRNKIRKAEKNGMVVREVPFDDALVRGIHAVYNESPIRQGKRFWHYGEDLETIRRIKATFLERSIFIGAFFEDSLIGFAKLVANEDGTQAGLMHILSMIQHRDKAPTNALIAQAVRSCAEREIPNLWYANFSYGRKQRDSLADFKRYNGFQRVELPRYYVPLTAAGRIALRLDLHHSIADRIPEPVAATYRRIRSLWYTKRFPGFEGAKQSTSESPRKRAAAE